MSLAEQIDLLCKQHDLTSISLSFFPSGPAVGFHAYAHGGGVVGSSSRVKASAEDAIGSALADLDVKRGGVIDVPMLEAA